MRLAWFRPATLVSDRLDDTAALIAELRSDHEIELVDQTRAHDFVRLDARRPFDLAVFELANTNGHAFVWPYLLHYPGVLRLRSRSLHDSRSASLRRQRRFGDRAAEIAFSDWDLVGAPILASRMTVVADPNAGTQLQRDYPAAQIRVAPIGVESVWGQSPTLTPSLTPTLPPRVGLLDRSRADVTLKAIDRARYAGATLNLMTEASPDRVLQDADVIVALEWPPSDEGTSALAAMAAGKAVIVLETESTAGWAALDPQTWQARGWSNEPPMVVSIDPRDEAHSLSLALRRLAGDESLRQALGTAARAWWQTHATSAHAANAWREILRDAASLAPPPRSTDWPAHLTADGTQRARQILGELGTGVDFLR